MSDDPSIGIDAETGATLTGWDHVLQSLRDVFLTRFGSRLIREWYGSFVPDALGRNINRSEMLPVIASITSAVEQWEPRFLLESVSLDGSAAREGRLQVTLHGRYRPRALLGDMTEAGPKTMIVAMAGDTVTAR